MTIPTLQLTDGTTTVDLSGASVSGGIRAYTPRPPKESKSINVTETMKILFRDTSLAGVLTTIRNVELLLEHARTSYQTGRGSDVYLKFRPADSETLYRSQVYDGFVDYDKDALNWQILSNLFIADIDLTRAPYWEADSESQIPLLSFATTPKTTDAVTIHNHTDSGHGNYVDIAAADVAGVVPTPVRLALVNSTASNQDFIIYIAHAWNGTPASIPSILEAESGIITGTMTNTPTAAESCSAGSYGALSWTGNGWAGLRWQLTAAQIQAIAGGNIHFLGRFKTLPSGVIKAAMDIYLPNGSAPIYSQPAEQYPTLSTTHYLQDFGSMRIPPSLAGVATLGALDVRLLFTKTGGGALDLDFVALMPTDSFKCIKAVVTGAVNTDTVMIDDTTGDTYIQAAGGTRTGQLVSYGTPIMLVPGKRQFLWFLIENNVPGMDIDRSHTLQAFYRPRRLTI